jgi:hypothetical protein
MNASRKVFDGINLIKGLYMVIKMAISLKTLTKVLYAVKSTNFIEFYKLKQDFFSEVNILKRRSGM